MMDAPYKFFYNQISLCASFKIKFVPLPQPVPSAYVSQQELCGAKLMHKNLCVVKSFFFSSFGLPFFFLFFTHWPAVNHSMKLASRKTGPTIFLAARLLVFILFLFCKMRRNEAYDKQIFLQTQIRALKRKGKEKV